MSDPKADFLAEAGNITVAVVTGNYAGVIEPAKRLIAMAEVYLVPPIDAPALDPADRAAVDAEVDAEVK